MQEEFIEEEADENLPAVNTDERELERVLDDPIYGGTVPHKHLYLSVSTCTRLWYNESQFFSPAMLMLSSYIILSIASLSRRE